MTTGAASASNFATRHWQGDPINNEPDAADGIEWRAMGHAAEDTAVHITLAMLSIACGQRTSFTGWP
ncbi:hypothetical protein [Streptomyces chryseus]